MKTSIPTLAATLFFLLPALSEAQAPFSATLSVADNSGIPSIMVSGSNFIDFANNILAASTTASGQLQAFNGHPYNVASTFLGTPNAITYASSVAAGSNNAAGTQVTVGLTPIGFTKTFSGSSASAVNSQIDDFFEKNGLGIFSSFLKAISQSSPIATTDGNPNSATAVAANSVFLNQGLTSSSDLADQSAGAKPQFKGLALGFDAGSFKAGAFKGDTYDISFTVLNLGFGNNVRLEAPVNFNYLTVEGAKVAGVGVDLVLPIKLMIMDAKNPWNWRLTPIAGFSGRASVDLAGGGALWDVGLVNTIDYRVNPKLILCLMDQLTDHQSFSISYGTYSFDPQVSQDIAKNGVRVVSPLSRSLIVDFFVIETNFLKTAYTKEFTTIGSSFALKATKHFNLSLAANYDTGPSFQEWSVGLDSAWRW